MRVPDEVLKCVVFVGYEDSAGEIRLAGTAFFLTMEIAAECNDLAVYLVTAKHVIDGIRMNGATEVVLRLNTVTGGTLLVDSDIDMWRSDPDDPYLDVAALAWAPPRDTFEFRSIPESMVAVDTVITEREIGAGDEAFLTGLFVSHFGQQRNMPIVRVGSIAAMPEEPVQTKFFGTEVAIDAYLLEARSIGGLSGSPVFVVTSGTRGRKITVGPQYMLLGLMHGHWDVEFSSADAVVSDGIRSEAVNMGIAIVIPATKIMDVLNLPPFTEQRQAAAEECRAKRGQSAEQSSGNSDESQ